MTDNLTCDICIYGTGILECSVSVCLSLLGYNVIQVDYADTYGGYQASLSLNDLFDWIQSKGGFIPPILSTLFNRKTDLFEEIESTKSNYNFKVDSQIDYFDHDEERIRSNYLEENEIQDQNDEYRNLKSTSTSSNILASTNNDIFKNNSSILLDHDSEEFNNFKYLSTNSQKQALNSQFRESFNNQTSHNDNFSLEASIPLSTSEHAVFTSLPDNSNNFYDKNLNKSEENHFYKLIETNEEIKLKITYPDSNSLIKSPFFTYFSTLPHPPVILLFPFSQLTNQPSNQNSTINNNNNTQHPTVTHKDKQNDLYSNFNQSSNHKQHKNYSKQKESKFFETQVMQLTNEQEQIIHELRLHAYRFNIDLLPKLLHRNSDFTQLLINSNASHYLDFIPLKEPINILTTQKISNSKSFSSPNTLCNKNITNLSSNDNTTQPFFSTPSFSSSSLNSVSKSNNFSSNETLNNSSSSYITFHQSDSIPRSSFSSCSSFVSSINFPPNSDLSNTNTPSTSIDSESSIQVLNDKKSSISSTLYNLGTDMSMFNMNSDVTTSKSEIKGYNEDQISFLQYHNVPISKQGIFSDKSLALSEKRSLMRFVGHLNRLWGSSSSPFFGSLIHQKQRNTYTYKAEISKNAMLLSNNVAQNGDSNSSVPNNAIMNDTASSLLSSNVAVNGIDIKDNWYQYLVKNGLSEFLCILLSYGLCMCSDSFANMKKNWTIEQGWTNLALFLNSLEHPTSPQAFLYTMYGTGDLTQALSRSAAVAGTTHILRASIKNLIFKKSHISNNSIIKSNSFISSVSNFQLSSDLQSNNKSKIIFNNDVKNNIEQINSGITNKNVTCSIQVPPNNDSVSPRLCRIELSNGLTLFTDTLFTTEEQLNNLPVQFLSSTSPKQYPLYNLIHPNQNVLFTEGNHFNKITSTSAFPSFFEPFISHTNPSYCHLIAITTVSLFSSNSLKFVVQMPVFPNHPPILILQTGFNEGSSPKGFYVTHFTHISHSFCFETLKDPNSHVTGNNENSENANIQINSINNSKISVCNNLMKSLHMLLKEQQATEKCALVIYYTSPSSSLVSNVNHLNCDSFINNNSSSTNKDTTNANIQKNYDNSNKNNNSNDYNKCKNKVLKIPEDSNILNDYKESLIKIPFINKIL